MIKKAIIPAAGYGTRSLPITKVIPKEMFPISNKPSIQYIVEEATAAGIEQILMIVSRSKSIIVDYFDTSLELETFLQRANKSSLMDKLKMPNIQILYTRQSFAKGLGDAIWLGKDFIGNDPFAVLLPDDIIVGQGIAELIKVYEEKKTNVIGLKPIAEDLLKNYGVIKGKPLNSELYQVLDVIEKPIQNPPSNLAVIGRYVFTPEIIKLLGNQEPGAGGEVQLTDSIKRGLEKEPCHGKIITGLRYDIGLESDYLAIQQLMSLQKKG